MSEASVCRILRVFESLGFPTAQSVPVASCLWIITSKNVTVDYF